MDFLALDRLKLRLDTFRPLPKEVVANLHENLIVEWTYNSNAIEGNTLTLQETKVALEGVAIGGKTLREHFEAISYKEAMHPIEKAARVHIDFVGIHPFVDGNGRTSRLLMNLELMKSGFPPVIFKVEDRLEYYQALDLAHTTDNYEPFLELTYRIVKKSFEPYFYVLGIN